MENRLVVAAAGQGLRVGGWRERDKIQGKRYKLPVIKYVSPGDVTYSTVIIVNTDGIFESC